MPHFSIPDKTKINYYAGLAWWKKASTHLPKTRKMKTTREPRNDQETKRLFQQLFDAQHKLERCAYRSHPQVQMIISLIDHILQKILDSVDEYES